MAERRGHQDGHSPRPGHDHTHDARGHSHGLIHESIKRSREGIHAVSLSLAVLGLAAVAQTVVFVVTGSP